MESMVLYGHVHGLGIIALYTCFNKIDPCRRLAVDSRFCNCASHRHLSFDEQNLAKQSILLLRSKR